jgi:hypothetical protein
MDKDNPQEPIAIIGSACRLPRGASSPSKLWQLLKKPRDLLKDTLRDRFHLKGVCRADGLHGSIKTHKAYFLDENIREFDPDFVKLSPAEAENLDPQHRHLRMSTRPSILLDLASRIYSEPMWVCLWDRWRTRTTITRITMSVPLVVKS